MRVLADILQRAGRPVSDLKCPLCGSTLFEAERDDRDDPETGWTETTYDCLNSHDCLVVGLTLYVDRS